MNVGGLSATENSDISAGERLEKVIEWLISSGVSRGIAVRTSTGSRLISHGRDVGSDIRIMFAGKNSARICARRKYATPEALYTKRLGALIFPLNFT